MWCYLAGLDNVVLLIHIPVRRPKAFRSTMFGNELLLVYNNDWFRIHAIFHRWCLES